VSTARSALSSGITPARPLTRGVPPTAYRLPPTAYRLPFLAAVLVVVALALGVATPSALAQDAGLWARVADAATDVPLRTEPTYDAEVAVVLAGGTAVQLRIDEADTVADPDGITRWWPVRFEGHAGWIAGFFLEGLSGDAASSPEASSTTPTWIDTTVSAVVASAPAPTGEFSIPEGVDFYGLTALIASPEGVILRAEPSYEAEVVAPVAAGAVVELRIADTWTVVDAGGAHWWPVRYWGMDGWVPGAYLAPNGAAAAPAADPATWAEAAAPTDPGVAAAPPVAAAAGVTGIVDWSWTVAAITGEGGVNLRTEASFESAVLAPIAAGTVVPLRTDEADAVYDATGTRWWPVLFYDLSGWVAGLAPAADGVAWPEWAALPSGETPASDAFVAAEAPAPAPEPAPEVAAEPAPAPLPPPPAAPEPAPAPAAPGPVGAFIYPTQGTLTQSYGCSPYWFEPFDAGLGCNFHNGIDLANVAGTDIVAADGGVVRFAGWCDCGLGYYVEIDHGNGFATVYGHMASQPYVASGQAVGRGEVIGPLGSTGNSTGPHLHFMLKLNGATVDPLAYL